MSAGIPRRYLLGEPTHWAEQLPTLDEYGNDVTAWLSAIRDLYDARNTPAYAGDTDLGNGMTAAGISPNSPNFGKSAEQLAAETLNRKFLMSNQPGVKGPGFGLILDSRQHIRPDEVQQAYDAMTPEGKPVLLDPVAAYLEEVYGISPSHPYQAPGSDPTTAPPTPGVNDVREEAWRRAYETFQILTMNGQGAGLQPPQRADYGLPPLGDTSAVGPGAPEPPPVAPQQGVSGGDVPTPGMPGPYDGPTFEVPGGPGSPSGGQNVQPGTQPAPHIMAAQLAQQYGNTSTIDPRYPDWMLKFGQLVGNRPGGPIRPAQAMGL